MNQSEQVAALTALLEEWEKKLASGYMEGNEQIQRSEMLKAIQQKIEETDVVGAYASVSEAAIAAAYAEFLRRSQSAFISGGIIAEKIAGASQIVFAFDVTGQNPAKFYQNFKADKIRQIARDLRDQIERAVQEGSRAGVNPKEIAMTFRENLGLTAKQEQAVSNYRRMLDELDRTALERVFRDRRFDRTVERAIRARVPLSDDQKKKMVDRFREKAIKRRAETIARTEVITLVNGGNLTYWEDLAQSGQVDVGRLLRKWIITPDERLRHSHAMIPLMNKEGVGLRDYFKSPLGPIRFPGDPSAPAANRINCRCTIFTRIRSE